MCVRVLIEYRRGCHVIYSGAPVTMHCWMPNMNTENQSLPLQEQFMFPTTEPSLQPLNQFLMLFSRELKKRYCNEYMGQDNPREKSRKGSIRKGSE